MGKKLLSFPVLGDHLQAVLEAKCLSSEIISERLACSYQSWRCPPWETSISSEVLPVGGGADQLHARLMTNEHSPLARGLSLPWSFLSLARVCSRPTRGGHVVFLGSKPPDASDQPSLYTEDRFASLPGQNWVQLCHAFAQQIGYDIPWRSEWTESCSVVSDSLRPHGPFIVHGILQARIPEWVAVPFSRGSSQPRDRTQVSSIAGRFVTSWATREAHPWRRWSTKPDRTVLRNSY